MAVFLRASGHCPAGMLFWGSVELSHREAMCLSVFVLSLCVLIYSESGVLACFPHERVSLYLPIIVGFCCCDELSWQNATLFHFADLGYSSSLWRIQGRNFKHLVISHPPSRAESNEYMYACLPMLSSSSLPLLSSGPLAQGMVPLLEMISQYFLFIAQWYSVILIFHISFIHLLVGKHLESSWFVLYREDCCMLVPTFSMWLYVWWTLGCGFVSHVNWHVNTSELTNWHLSHCLVFSGLCFKVVFFFFI